MMKRVVNLLRGEVRGRVVSGFPERVLNICGEYDIRFWDLNWESAVAFTFTMTRRNWKKLRRLSRRLDCEMQAVSWRGTPFFLGRMRRRHGLWITAALCTMALFYGSFFIWDIEIEGNERVSELEILRALEQHGVAFGTFGYGVNSTQTRNDLLLDLPELSYIAVNVKGCRAYVQVRERIQPPQIIDSRKPGNTVAAKDALITAVQPWGGEKQVLPGTTVKEGQLLISGVMYNDYSGTRYLRGMGRVYGRTWYTLRCQIPMIVQEKTYTGGEIVRRAVVFGKNRVNLYFDSSIRENTCDKIINWNQYKLPGDIPLPVTMVTERLREYTLTERRRSEQEAMTLAELSLVRRLSQCIEDGKVLSRSYDTEIVDDTLLVTLTVECEEQIGKFVDIPKE